MAMTENEVDAEEKLWMELAMQRAQLDAECIWDKVEQEPAGVGKQ